MIRNRYIVDNKLIRGSKPRFRDVLRLKQEGITQIICLSKKKNYAEKLACKVSNIQFVQYKRDIIDQNFLNMEDFKNISNQISEHNGKTFIHCGVGLHRTAECVAAYNILKKGKGFREALTEDMFEKKYFETKYKPLSTIHKQNDSFRTHLEKRHNKKIYLAITKSLQNFINIFKPQI